MLVNRSALKILECAPLQKETDVCKESLPPPAFDLSSDDMWPSIAGVTTAGSGSGQGAWLSSDGSSPGKGWSSIVKTVPSSVKVMPMCTRAYTHTHLEP